MNMICWSPSRELSVLQNQMNRLFGNALEGWPDGNDNNTTNYSWSPSADIYETENELVVKADLPGVDPKQIDVRVENNVLTIRGERHFEKEVKDENFHRVERNYGSFLRSF